MIGIEFTTFSLIGRCECTGMFGIAISTSEMAVGSRCIHVVPGVGAAKAACSVKLPRLLRTSTRSIQRPNILRMRRATNSARK